MRRGVFVAEGETLTGGCAEWHSGELRGLDSIKILLQNKTDTVRWAGRIARIVDSSETKQFVRTGESGRRHLEDTV